MKNFIIRALTGIAIVAVQVLCTYLSPISLAALFLLLTALAVNEFLGLLIKKGKVRIGRPLIVAGSCYLFFAVWLNCLTEASLLALFLPYLLFIIFCCVRELYNDEGNPIVNLGAIMLSQLYVALPLSLINLLAFSDCYLYDCSIKYYVFPLAMYVFLWLNDTGAYLCGSLLGKHKLFPRISPKKSWEGSIGGAIVAMASAVAVAHFFPVLNVWQWVGMALVVVVAGTYGDLTESMIKRSLDVKDSGRMLPGHGGILDRLDSMLFAIPASVIYLYVLSWW
ncbi:MAG: phosphatidate cytidylyltransferase [Bacteroidaceae bacterium]|nr:phosphatidate cytidylyltransferase [Bacteroidaceae bacterium]